MKIQKSLAVAFLLDLGFAKAGEWDDAKIVERLSQVPTKMTAEQVNDEFAGVYKDLVACEGKGITLSTTSPDAKPEKPAKPEAKPAKKSNVDKALDKVAKAKAEKAEKEAAAKAKAKGKTEKPEKPAKTPKAKKEKVEKEKDKYGCTVGSVRAAVNAAFSKEWKTDIQVAEEAGVTVRQARFRLRRATKAGLLEKQRMIRYRIAPVSK